MSQMGTYGTGATDPILTLTGNSGGAVGPDGSGNINVVGSGVVSTAGNPGTNTLTISVSGAVSTSFATDAGTAVPSGGVLTIAGAGTVTTSGAGSTVTITGSSSYVGLPWSVINADQSAVVNNGYICNKAGTLVLTLPATSAIGDVIRVTGMNTALGWQIAQGAGQQIYFGATNTTLGAGGSLASSATRDAIEMVCIVVDTTWQVISSVGNITVV